MKEKRDENLTIYKEEATANSSWFSSSTGSFLTGTASISADWIPKPLYQSLCYSFIYFVISRSQKLQDLHEFQVNLGKSGFCK